MFMRLLNVYKRLLCLLGCTCLCCMYEGLKQYRVCNVMETFIFVLAEKLFCPYFTTRQCGCVQNYIVGQGSSITSILYSASSLLYCKTQCCFTHPTAQVQS